MMAHLQFDFGWKLSDLCGGTATCPACKRISALHIDMGNNQDIGFSCSAGCTRQNILAALDQDPDATYYVQTGVPLLAKKSTKPRLTWEQLLFEYGMRGWGIRFNEITREVEVDAKSELTQRMLSLDDVVTVFYSDLGDNYKGCTLDALHTFSQYIARDNTYNPVLDLIASTTWDGSDRRQELFELMGIQDDTLSQILVFKWLLQSVALLYNNEQSPFGADGVLVLNGCQGVGKTSLFKRLALNPRWFGEGYTIKDNDKDTPRRCVTRWITELGEVESTLKSDISALKAFVTSDTDTYRLPYGRSDVKAARRTSLCATCNSDRYLIDTTGNRRWWSVPLSAPMDYDRIQKFDALQLWAQIHALVAPLSHTDKAACFRLTREEQAMLAERNGSFEKPIKAELECRDIIDAANQQQLTWQFMTTTQFKTQHEALRPYSTEQIGRALQKIGIVQERKRLPGEQNASRGYTLPSSSVLPYEIRRVK